MHRNILQNMLNMDEKSLNTLCRICLEDGAIFPIFEMDNKENNIYSKLITCVKEKGQDKMYNISDWLPTVRPTSSRPRSLSRLLRHAWGERQLTHSFYVPDQHGTNILKIEDVDGFPRCICNICNSTLDTVCNFINKYKESSKILEGGLLKLIKDEHINHYKDYNNFGDSDIDVKIKTEVEIDYEDSLEDTEPLSHFVKPLKLNNDTIKKVKKETVQRNKTKVDKVSLRNKTNKIASSILEGGFSWNGEKWCLTSNKTSTSEPSQRVAMKCVRDKNIRKVKAPKGPKPEPTKLCDLCGEVFKNHDRLSVHKKNVHFKNPAKCPKCPRVCVSEYYLNRHIRRKHDMNKEFICATCGQGFAFKGELSSHNKNVHNKHLKKKKVYQCKYCDKNYKCQKSVTIHERSIHTGQRPAECSVCGSSFYHEDYLKEHMRLHTGETPFKCPICGRGYAQRCNMKSHLRIHRVAEIDPDVLSKLRPTYLKLLKDFR